MYMGTDFAQETENIVYHSNPDVNVNIFPCGSLCMSYCKNWEIWIQVTFGDQLSCVDKIAHKNACILEFILILF